MAIFMALFLFMIPARRKDENGNMGSILNIGTIRNLPWRIVLLFGGGFALAKGFQTSGLSEWVGAKFVGLEGTPPMIMVAVVSFAMTFLTELTSNTATTEMVLPLLASISQSIEVNPLYLMLPATISASCAFMMPVATPPNAIVFGSGRINMIDMVKAGFVLNLVGVVIISLYLNFFAVPKLAGSADFPDWAKKPTADEIQKH